MQRLPRLASRLVAIAYRSESFASSGSSICDACCSHAAAISSAGGSVTGIGAATAARGARCSGIGLASPQQLQLWRGFALGGGGSGGSSSSSSSSSKKGGAGKQRHHKMQQQAQQQLRPPGSPAAARAARAPGAAARSGGASGAHEPQPPTLLALLGSPEGARARIRVYVTLLLFVGAPVLFAIAFVRSMLATAAALMLSPAAEARRLGARRARRVLWTDGAARRAVELRIDEALLALVDPATPQGARVHGGGGGMGGVGTLRKGGVCISASPTLHLQQCRPRIAANMLSLSHTPIAAC